MQVFNLPGGRKSLGCRTLPERSPLQPGAQTASRSASLDAEISKYHTSTKSNKYIFIHWFESIKALPLSYTQGFWKVTACAKQLPPPHRKHCCQPAYHTAVVTLYHYLSTLPCNTLPWCQTSISAHNEWMSSFLYYNLNTFCNYMKAWIHGVHAHLCKLTPSWTYSNPPK